LLQEFTDVTHVDIVSKAELKIHPSLNIRQLSTHNDVTRVNVLHLHVTYRNRFLFFHNATGVVTLS